MFFLNTILDILFPKKCLACGDSGAELCLKCLREVRTAERESADWIFPLYDYRDPTIKKGLWLFKYKNKRTLADVFAVLLHDKIAEELSELMLLQNFRDPLLVPIPLSPKRYRERGFNQAELLCKALLKINSPTPKIHSSASVKMQMLKDILIKTKETEHQARIKNRSERLKNLTGSFAVKNPESVKGRNIILVDDITTTGATLNEARKVLKNFGARKIIAFTVAH